MNKSLLILWRYFRAFALIYACLYAGILAASLLPVAIPGSIIGMLILLTLLALQILPYGWVSPGGSALIRYMAVLFVPTGVGVMQYFALVEAQFTPLVVSCLVSSLMVFLVTGWSAHLIYGAGNQAGGKGTKP